MTKKDITQIAITGVLIVVLVVVTIQTFSGMKKPSSIRPKIADLGGMAVPQGVGGQNIFVQLEAQVKELRLERDPFFKQQEGSFTGPSLEGIIWSEENPTAIINDVIVQVGSAIKGYKVLTIEKTRVILYDEERNIKFPLEMFE